MTSDPAQAVRAVDALRIAGLTVAVAESLTAGLVCAQLADVPGASAVLRGGVVVYCTDLKQRLLGIDADLLARHGPVHPQVAAEMARAVRILAGADIGVATTGVAGPGPSDGHPAGTVCIAVNVRQSRGPDRTQVRTLALPGQRGNVRKGSVDAVLGLLLEVLAPSGAPPDR